MPTSDIGVPPLVRFSLLAVESLAAAREEIDALNVYPVPDGDTGTNLFLTFESAHAALQQSLGGDDPERADFQQAVSVYSRGLLLGARGNSGVIMSQLVETLLRHLAGAAHDDTPAGVFARGMAAATEAAYAAVGEPVEGTMLTVARAASDAARQVVADDAAAPLAHLLSVASGSARDALARTPEQLEVLRDAGVVDAGGSGLCLVLEAAESAYTGRRRSRAGKQRRSRAARATPVVPTDDLTEDGPAYEVMYLLDADDEAIPPLRAALQPLGDSLVVVGGQGLWNVHVHVDDVGAAVEAGIEAGRPHRVRVTHFAEQVHRMRRRTGDRPEAQDEKPEGRRVVVLAFGPGLAKIFEEAGGHVVQAVDRPSTGDVLEAVRATNAAEVVVVPNDRDVVPAAEAAARLAESEHGIRVAVIPTTAQVQGMAALAVHEPSRPFEQDLVEMAAAARHARSGAVTIAARRAITTAGLCEPGDVLGAVEGDFVVVGDDLHRVAVDVVERMLGGGGELFTVIAGRGGEELARRCAAHLEDAHPTVDVLVYDGGQDRYPLLFGVE